MHHKYISPILMWFIIIIGVIIILEFSPQFIFWNKNILTFSIFGISIIYWCYFFIHAALNHRKAALSVDKIDKLITTGIYNKVRHPIYSADIFLLIGIFVLIGNLKCLFSIIWSIIILIFWVKLEEKGLTKKFGKKYQDYKKKTPMLIPKINFKK